MDILAVLTLLTTVSFAVPKKPTCPTDATSCSECITANVKCAWCSAPNYLRGPRCLPLSKMKKGSTCPDEHVVSPERTSMVVTKAREIRRNRPIEPQMINLKLRRGAKVTIPFKVKAKTTPLTLRFRYPRGVRIVAQADCVGFELKKKLATCPTSNGNTVNVTMTVHMKRCLPKPKKIKVIVGSFKKRPLKVTLTSLCRCDCEKPEEKIVQSSLCRNKGTYACGICSCDEGVYGKHCECEKKYDRCTAPGMSEACSGHGECLCGKCQCDGIAGRDTQMRYTGRFCECDDTACDLYQGQLCGGSSRGLCKCGKCMCFPGYAGPSCGMSMAVDRCRNPKTSMLCSGRGRCVDNICECEDLRERESGGRRITGQYCQCDSGSCSYFNGKICGGRGRCSCGQCICNDGFSGEDCSIDMSTDNCRSPVTGLICNGQGRCFSNMCRCNSDFRGVTCDDCPSCPGPCQRLMPCVQCFVFASGSLTPEQCNTRCGVLGIEIVDDVAVQERDGPNYRLCMLRDEDNCLMKFAYLDTRIRRSVRVERNRMC
ncbi:integrin beta-1-like isoform X2 [Haliotis rufescens]|nr:integrin beta-1-like isoform X2 [Haliotis rufescens]XP_046354852.1 integrin beta-1-like isoform X2 [Haliotis rufescens]